LRDLHYHAVHDFGIGGSASESARSGEGRGTTSFSAWQGRFRPPVPSNDLDEEAARRRIAAKSARFDGRGDRGRQDPGRAVRLPHGALGRSSGSVPASPGGRRIGLALQVRFLRSASGIAARAPGSRKPQRGVPVIALPARSASRRWTAIGERRGYQVPSRSTERTPAQRDRGRPERPPAPPPGRRPGAKRREPRCGAPWSLQETRSATCRRAPRPPPARSACSALFLHVEGARRNCGAEGPRRRSRVRKFAAELRAFGHETRSRATSSAASSTAPVEVAGVVRGYDEGAAGFFFPASGRFSRPRGTTSGNPRDCGRKKARRQAPVEVPGRALPGAKRRWAAKTSGKSRRRSASQARTGEQRPARPRAQPRPQLEERSRRRRGGHGTATPHRLRLHRGGVPALVVLAAPAPTRRILPLEVFGTVLRRGGEHDVVGRVRRSARKREGIDSRLFKEEKSVPSFSFVFGEHHEPAPCRSA